MSTYDTHAATRTAGSDLADEFTGSQSPPTMSVDPTGIYHVGYDETFTLTVTHPQNTDLYWRYPGTHLTLITESGNRATFRTGRREGVYDIYAYVQNRRGLMNFTVTRVIVQDYLTTPPSPPRNLSIAGKSHNYIDLTFEGSMEGDPVGYEISRRLNRPGLPWDRIATVGANQFTYRDTDVSPDTTYQYVVRAYNAGGYSGVSNAVALSTRRVPPPPPAYPNLVPQAFSIPVILNRTSKTIWINFTVGNIGAEKAKGPWYAEVREGGRFICTMRFEDLLPGESQTKRCLYGLPRDTTQGETRTLTVVVDYNNRVIESNEDDNVTSQTVTFIDFEPPSGLRCTQTDSETVLCVWNQEFYDSFSVYVVERGEFYCDGVTHPSCLLTRLVPGVYRAQVRARDHDTNSNEITKSYMFVVAEEFVRPWTIAEVTHELDQGSLRSDLVLNLQTRWGRTDTYVYVEGNPASYAEATVTIGDPYRWPIASVLMPVCMGISAASYTFIVNGTALGRFRSGVREDTSWQDGGVLVSFDFQEYRPGNVDYCGIMTVTVPTALLGTVPVSIGVSATENGGAWDWFLFADRTAQYRSAEVPVGVVTGVMGEGCFPEFGTVYGEYRACVSHIQEHHTVSVDVPVERPYAWPSVALWGALGSNEGTVAVRINDILVGTINSGASDSTVWAYPQAVFWWVHDRRCTCESDHNGWMVVTIDPALMSTEAGNMIEFTGVSGQTAWIATNECSYGASLLHPKEGFASFLPESLYCEVLPTTWGVSVYSCYARMREGVPEVIAWETPPVMCTETTCVITWLGANGVDLAPFELAVNGVPVLTIWSGQTTDVTWYGDDGMSRLTFTYAGYMPGSTDYNGIYTLVIPSSLIVSGEATMLSLTSAGEGGSLDWIAVFGFTETEVYRKTRK